ncbi:hypothetical protein GCM10027026_21060 [Myroides odoratimimus subsp. xuanwuensis]
MIRPGTEADLPRLVTVEVEAGRVFRTIGMPEIAEDLPDIAALREAIEARRLWVTVLGSGASSVLGSGASSGGGSVVAGYVVAEVLDANAHVAQVSVAPDFAGRALGRAMLEHVEAWGRDAGHRATTLTTFRAVPWNGPYYLRLGYGFLSEDEIDPQLAATMAHEASLPGVDGTQRCAMIKSSAAR